MKVCVCACVSKQDVQIPVNIVFQEHSDEHVHVYMYQNVPSPKTRMVMERRLLFMLLFAILLTAVDVDWLLLPSLSLVSKSRGGGGTKRTYSKIRSRTQKSIVKFFFSPFFLSWYSS